MEANRRSFLGMLVAFLMAPLIGYASTSRRVTGRLAGKTIEVTRKVWDVFGFETITINGDDESLKVFSEDWGIDVKEYVPYKTMAAGEYEKGGAFYFKSGNDDLNVMYYVSDAQVFGAFGAPSREQYDNSRADGIATATADVARSIQRCRQEGAEVIDHGVVECPIVKTHSVIT